MHITHIIDGLPIGGAERMVTDLSAGLMRLGHRVSVISLSRRPLSEQPAARWLMEAGVEVVSIPKQSRLDLGLVGQLRDWLATEQPDVVHTHLFAADVWGVLAAKQAGIQTILSTEHNINHSEGKLKHMAKCLTGRYRTGTVAVSEAVAAYSRKTCPATAGKLTVIPNGVDLQRFAAPHTPAHDTPQLTVVGRLVPQKGHADLLNGLTHITIPYHLQIIGDGPERAALTAHVTQLGLTDRVTFTDTRQNVEQVYADSDLVIIPSRWEGFGLVAVEAMAAGCAVAASDIDGLKELIQDNSNGVLIDFTNPTQAAAQLTRLLTDPKLRARLGETARTSAQNYSIEKMVIGYEKLYQDKSH